MTPTEKITAFRDLHEGCFVLPNPWDRGSARILASLGFSALATSSAALAFTMGLSDRPDAVGVEPTLDNIREVVEATDLPVNADFQAGYGDDPDVVYANVGRCIATGIAGLSIEDASDVPGQSLYPSVEAVRRVEAARAAIDDSGSGVVLTARAECFLVGHPDPLAESLRRLESYAAAGADCLYAPGIKTEAEIRAVLQVAGSLPVNVLAADPTTMTVESLRALGVSRISVGSALARVAWGAFIKASQAIASTGAMAPLAGAEPFASFAGFFEPDVER